MATTFGNFAKELREFGAGLPDKVNKLKVSVAGIVSTDCIDRTLVDTGEAMSNWIVNNGSAVTTPRPAFVPSPKGKMVQNVGVRHWVNTVTPSLTRQANRAPALDVANATLREAKPGVPIHITNSVAHIGYLNDGTEHIQPANFAEHAILIVSGTIERYKLL